MLLRNWRVVGRPKQQMPEGKWTFWLILAGRGYGKTLTGAQFAKRIASEEMPGCRFALVGPTLRDCRRTMVEGESGLLSVFPAEALFGQSREIAWNKSSLELTLANGSRFECFSSETPDRLRGPAHHAAWCDELSSFRDAQRGDDLNTTWSNLKLGCRLGDQPRICITTTPKANKLTKQLLQLKQPRIRITRGSSYENRENLSEAWWEEVVVPYEGKRIGRQEIEAQILDDVEGALWRRGQLDALRVTEHPNLERLIVAVDPNASSDEAANDAGIIVVGSAGSGLEKVGYVLDDRTITEGGPRAWAKAAVQAYLDYEADKIVAEKNNGGEMVEITIHTVDPHVPVKLVNASRGKRTRAEPIAAMYEGDEQHPARIHHVGAFPDLEDQMCEWTPDAESPDRMDALVWGMTELMLGRQLGRASVSVPKGRVPAVGAGTVSARR